MSAWQIGDLAECVDGDNWIDADGNPMADGPAHGDVLSVMAVDAGAFLAFAPWPRDSFLASSFRKLPPESAATPAFAAEIKSFGRRVFA